MATNNDSRNSQLAKDLSDFLRSSATNVEWMSSDLREKLHVPTGLEEVIKKAVAEKRNVVIAGTAGSGKTHLLQALGRVDGYETTNDLSALPEEEWPNLFSRGKRILIAGNEGAFLQASHKQFPGFDDVVRLLHAVQKGEDPTGSGPVVIDAAGFDPAGSHVIERILGLKLLTTYAKELPDLAAAAWKMFEDDNVRRRLAVLVEAASAETGSDGFTFRQLWQFVADMLEAGRENDQPWFSRIFCGACEVSRRITNVVTPVSLPLPHVGNQLWHGDYDRLRDGFLDCAHPVLDKLIPEMIRDQTNDARLSRFRTLRILAAFGLRQSPIDGVVDSGVDLWSKVRRREASPLIQAINHYFAVGLIELADDLELWLQHDTERRTIKPNVQVSLGTARANDFSIRRSSVIANRPSGVEQIEGGRLLLVHNPSGATLSVTKDLIDGILRTRSHRTNERRDVEYDWRLGRFFEQVAALAARPDKLKVAKFDFQARSGRIMVWQIGEDQIRRVAN